MIENYALERYLNKLLNPNQIKDYAPNGLQVEGREKIKKIVTGVTASLALIERAIELQAHAIIVHHGYFWKGEAQNITGVKYNRIKALIQNNINLFGYHLPLDIHPELGNNAQLAKRLNLHFTQELNTDTTPNLGIICEQPTTLIQLVENITKQLQRAPLVVGSPKQEISKIAICTGGAQDFLEHAHRAGADVYISGEISERTTLLARELGMTYIAAGHHATERYGAKALGRYLSENLDLTNHFIDIDNPA